MPSASLPEEAAQELHKLRDENTKWRGAAEKAGHTLKNLMVNMTGLLNGLAAGEYDAETMPTEGIPEPILAPVRTMVSRLAAGGVPSGESDGNEVATLRQQLQEIEAERNQLAEEHEAVMTRMRGLKDGIQSKLQADQGELSALKTRVTELTQENEEMSAHLEHLKQQNAHLAAELNTMSSENDNQAGLVSGYVSQINELRTANEHATLEQEKLQREIMRLREHMMEANDEQAQEQLRLEDQVKEMERQISLLQREREQLEELAHQEKAEAETWKAKIGNVDDMKAGLTEERDKWRREYEKQTEAVRNLQLVLEQFQAAKDSEIGFAVDGLKRQLAHANSALEEYRTRAVAAEEKLSTVSTTGPAIQQLQSELAEKNMVIGKLRHDVLQLQTHLAEAMRRIKEVSDNSDLNVDRRLISNLIVQFMTIPRGDGKRFEILKIIANVLHFTEDEQYRVGLIRKPGGGVSSVANSVAASRRTSMEDPRTPNRGAIDEVDIPYFSLAVLIAFADGFIFFYSLSRNSGSPSFKLKHKVPVVLVRVRNSRSTPR